MRVMRVSALFLSLLLLPFNAWSGGLPPVVDAESRGLIRDALREQGVAWGDLTSADRLPPGARRLHVFVGDSLRDPMRAPEIAGSLASAIARDGGGTPETHWEGVLSAISQSWEAKPTITECESVRSGLPLSSQHIATSEAAGERWSKRAKNDLATRLNPDLDRVLGGLADEAIVTGCRVESALSGVAASDRSALLQEAERWLGDDLKLPGEEGPALLVAAWSSVDRGALLGAAAAWMAAIDEAGRTLSGLDAKAWPAAPLIWRIGLGEVWIGSMGANSGAGNPVLLVDPGGDDHWRIRPNAPSVADGVLMPVRGWIDLGGDDVWRSGSVGPGSAVFGVASGLDLAGDDVHQGGTLAAGAGVFGVGSWLDVAGRDRYSVVAGGQGFGLAGAGVLRDQRRDDIYRADRWAQGAALPGGVGVLHDQRGGDRYLLNDDVREDREVPSSVAEALLLADCHAGCGQGFASGVRGVADGGLAVLVDDGGDDVYAAGERAQGAARWRGFAVARDGGGDDVWLAGSDAQGSADQGGVAVLQDAAGADAYTSHHRSMAWAGDGSVAWLVELSGADRFVVGDGGLGVTRARSAAAFVLDRDGKGAYSHLEHAPSRERLPGIGVVAGAGGPVATSLAGGRVQRDGPHLSVSEIVVALTGLDASDGVALRRLNGSIERFVELSSADREALVRAIASNAMQEEDTEALTWHLGWLTSLTRRAPLLAGVVEEVAEAAVSNNAWGVREAAWQARAHLAEVEGLTLAPEDALRIATGAAVAMQKESHADVRAAAARAAGAFGEAGVASSLVDALLTEHLGLRRSAEKALLALATRTDGVAIARGLYAVASGEVDSAPAVRDASLRVLGATRQRDAVPVLEAALAEEDARTSRAAVEGLARHGSRAALSLLEPWMQSRPDQKAWIEGLNPQAARRR